MIKKISNEAERSTSFQVQMQRPYKGRCLLCAGSSINVGKNDKGSCPLWPCHPFSPLSTLTSPDIKTKLSCSSGWQKIFGSTISLWKGFFPVRLKEMSFPFQCRPSFTCLILAPAICLTHLLCIGKILVTKNSVSPCAELF